MTDWPDLGGSSGYPTETWRAQSSIKMGICGRCMGTPNPVPPAEVVETEVGPMRLCAIHAHEHDAGGRLFA